MSGAAETSILFSQDRRVIGDPGNGFSGVVMAETRRYCLKWNQG